MAVNANPSTLLTSDQYILQAYKKAGLLPIEADIGFDDSWNAKAAHGRLVLNRLLEDLANEGFLDHYVPFEVVDLTSGDGTYTLDSDLLNIVDVASYIPASNGSEVEETTGETPVHPISMHEWNSLSNKSSTGTPTRYFVHRNGASLEVHLWPLPNEAGKIRFRVHRLPGTNSNGSDNVDLKRHWGSWIVYALAYEFMEDTKMPIEERREIGRERNKLLERIKTYETPNKQDGFCFVHSTPWT